MHVPRIVLQKLSVGVAHRPFVIIVRHQGIQPRRQLLRKGHSVAIRVAAHRHIRSSVPVELLPRLFIVRRHRHDLDLHRRHVEGNHINRPAPFITLRHTVDEPIGKLRRPGRKRPNVLARLIRSHPNNVRLCRKQNALWFRAENTRWHIERIVLQQRTIHIPHRPLVIIVGHHRICPVRQFLRKGEPVSIRIARRPLI